MVPKGIIFVLAYVLSTYAVPVYAEVYKVSTSNELRLALAAAAANNEDDTIFIEDGIYKTTDDAGGAFTYVTDKVNKLSIVGSSPDKVVISGNSQSRVFYFGSMAWSSSVKVTNVTIKNGKISDCGGGIYSEMFIDAYNVVFAHNQSSSSGNAICVVSPNRRGFIDKSIIKNNGPISEAPLSTAISGPISISNSEISENSGGAIWSNQTNEYNNVKILNNAGRAIASCGGFKVMNESLIEGNGGAVIDDMCVGTYSKPVIKNTVIRNNTSSGYVVRSAENMTIVNTIFSNNLSESGYSFRKNAVIVNSLLEGSEKTISFESGAKVVNSSLYNFDRIACNGIGSFRNNFIDENLITGTVLKSGNVSGLTPGFRNELAGDFRLLMTSPLIDSGTTDIEGVILPTTDLEGKERVEGGYIDIGPYEYADKIPPTVTEFALPPTATTLTVPILEFAASDNELITGYFVTEVAQIPGADLPGWVLLPPRSYSFADAGSKTLYAFAKDAAGNVSPWLSATVSITPPLDGACGTANDAIFSTTPANNLCSTGVASSVAGSGPWYWTCLGENGGTTANCSGLPGVTLNLSIAGTGGGSVGGDISCTSGMSCSMSFNAGTVINLLSAPNSFSYFGGWSGACSSMSGDCSITMNGSQDVTAIFNMAPKAMIDTVGYKSLGAAYADAPLSAIIRTLDSDMTDTGLSFEQNKSINLIGGYKADYSGRSGLPTLLKGPLKVIKGRLAVDRLAVK